MTEALIRDIAATLAPYKIFKVGSKFVVKNNAGDVKATHDDRDAATQHLRALYANVPGAGRAAARKKWTGGQKRAVTEKAHGEFKDAQHAMKKPHKYRPMKGHVHVDFVYGGAGSQNGGGVYGSPCADCGQPAGAGGHTDGGVGAGAATGGSATASLLESAGGYPCACGRDFASATAFGKHLTAWALVEMTEELAAAGDGHMIDGDDDDPASLASAVDAALDAMANLVSKNDLTALPGWAQQAINLALAAGETVDDLLGAMNVPDPDDGMSQKAHVEKPTPAILANRKKADMACLPCERTFATENALVNHLQSIHR